MSDPLLTSLCSICHISSPKYKCPRCGLRTCSLACIRKHKKWSDCSGERDPTAYVPAKKLRTPAGVDHDYNFISKIERSRERSEKLIVEERRLLRHDDLRTITVRELKYKPGPNGRQRPYLVTRILRQQPKRGDKAIRRRADALDIRIINAPPGLSRNKENGTRWNKAAHKIIWQVEWLVFEHEPQGSDELQPKRVLNKVLENTPLWRSFRGCAGELDPALRNEDDRAGRSRIGGTLQDAHNSTWRHCGYDLQDPGSGVWTDYAGSRLPVWPSEVEVACRQKYKFFLAKPLTKPQVLIPVASSDTLSDILRRSTLLEYPTLYAFGKEFAIPAEFTVRTAPSAQLRSSGNNRAKNKGKRDRQQSPRGERPRKKVRFGLEEGEVLEEGEIMDDGEVAPRAREDDGGLEDDDERVDDGELDEGIIEDGVVEEELSLGEEDDDDTTSSSGSSDDEDFPGATVTRAKLLASRSTPLTS